jgi:hypothetical protein
MTCLVIRQRSSKISYEAAVLPLPRYVLRKPLKRVSVYVFNVPLWARKAGCPVLATSEGTRPRARGVQPHAAVLSALCGPRIVGTERFVTSGSKARCSHTDHPRRSGVGMGQERGVTCRNTAWTVARDRRDRWATLVAERRQAPRDTPVFESMAAACCRAAGAIAGAPFG